MGVYVKGMEMPKDCYDCPCHNGENGRCQITKETTEDKRPYDCPLVEENTGKWIPCKEKLPRLGEDVWVTVDGRSKIAFLLNRKTISEDYTQEWWTEDDRIYQFEEVTAWRPLYRPLPYKGEQDEN